MESLRKKFLYAIIVLAVLILASIVYFSSSHKNISDTSDTVKPSSAISASQNGLTGNVVSKNNSAAPTQDIANATNTALLNQAKKENIVVTDDQVQQTIDKGLSAYNVSKEEFAQKLSAAGMTYDQYEQALKSQIEISKLIREHVDLKNITVSDAEVEEYFNANKDQFSDFENNTDALFMLKSKIKSILLQKKQQSLIQKYVDQLGG